MFGKPKASAGKPAVPAQKPVVAGVRPKKKRGCLLPILIIVFLAGVGFFTFGPIMSKVKSGISLPSLGGTTGSSTSDSTQTCVQFERPQVETPYGALVLICHGSTVEVQFHYKGTVYTASFQNDSLYIHRGVPMIASGLVLWFNFDPQKGFVYWPCMKIYVDFLYAPGTKGHENDPHVPCDAVWDQRPDFKVQP